MLGALCITKKAGERPLSFEDILLDETLVEGDIWVYREALQEAGGINYRLPAKRNYELLLRIAQNYEVRQIAEERLLQYLCGAEEDRAEDWQHLSPTKEYDAEGWKTDAYVIGRYKKELLAYGVFDAAVLGVVDAGGEAAERYLERMLTSAEEYYKLYDCTQPILIYAGDDECYGVLDTFARCLGQAFRKLGQKVEYFDVSTRQIEELAPYIKRRFKAVIGMQTYMFSAKLKQGDFAHDRMDTPQYLFVFDHPIWMRNHLEKVPKRLCVMTPDGNYAKFVRDYYGHPARFFPPAGQDMVCEDMSRDYDVAFLGSYADGPARELWTIHKQDRVRSHLLNHYIRYMRKNLDETPERAFEKALADFAITYTREEFIELFWQERWVFLKMAQYYRRKVVEALLDAGIHLHVFGDTWQNCPMRENRYLVRHEAVFGEDALKVYARSKIALNVMTWHKDGFTERIANAMLQKAVVATDKTTYLTENFADGEDVVLFELGDLAELPVRVKELLEDEEKRGRIAQAGYEKAAASHTWSCRAAEMLDIIEEDS